MGKSKTALFDFRLKKNAMDGFFRASLKEKFDYLKMDENERWRFDKHMDYVRSEWGARRRQTGWNGKGAQERL